MPLPKRFLLSYYFVPRSEPTHPDEILWRHEAVGGRRPTSSRTPRSPESSSGCCEPTASRSRTPRPPPPPHHPVPATARSATRPCCSGGRPRGPRGSPSHTSSRSSARVRPRSAGRQRRPRSIAVSTAECRDRSIPEPLLFQSQLVF
jgi:hypothetical protein